MSTEPISIPTSTEGARTMLHTLNATYHVSWAGISEFLGVPAPTLSRFAKGGKLPHKYKRKLGLYYDRKISDMPKKELRWAIEHRQEI